MKGNFIIKNLGKDIKEAAVVGHQPTIYNFLLLLFGSKILYHNHYPGLSHCLHKKELGYHLNTLLLSVSDRICISRVVNNRKTRNSSRSII